MLSDGRTISTLVGGRTVPPSNPGFPLPTIIPPSAICYSNSMDASGSMIFARGYSKNIETSTITLQSDRIPFDEIIFPVTSIKPSSSNLARQIKPRPTDNRLRLLEKSEHSRRQRIFRKQFNLTPTIARIWEVLMQSTTLNESWTPNEWYRACESDNFSPPVFVILQD
ncbi:hypothetical protein Y600_6382 [Burkholderia pseudomallei MSHR3709]|nr:hypothetical protein Y600_6382 [Burkholderia pseudomallei MSHR3709]